MREKVLLLVIKKKGDRARAAGDDIEEMRELIYSSNGNVVDSLIASIDRPAPNYYLRKGKLAELKEKIDEYNVPTVVVSIDLSPIQARNLEELLTCKIVDRTALILDIFARHAKSRDGKLQVELAQYMYILPRISSLWEKFSRLGGGIGTRGPGEQILERDRRKVRKHITRLEKELDRLKRHRQLIRHSRKRKEFKVVSIVGYTNAGKSTLLRALTQAHVLVEDKLFATLDPITRKYTLANGKEILLSDTVGFLLDLPHDLIKAFHPTLEEINDADLVLIVIDMTNEEYAMHYLVVQKILKDLGAHSKKQILALNKVDAVDEGRHHEVIDAYPDGAVISAYTGHGLTKLSNKIMDALEK